MIPLILVAIVAWSTPSTLALIGAHPARTTGRWGGVGVSSTRLYLADNQKPESNVNDGDDDTSGSIFDIRTKWHQAKQEATNFWKDIIVRNAADDDEDNGDAAFESVPDKHNGQQQLSPPAWLNVMVEQVSNLMQGKELETGMEYIISVLARDEDEEEETRERTFFPEIVSVLIKYKEPVMSILSKYLGDLDFSKLNPSALWYYLEYQEEVKNASWKRRQHRYFEKVVTDEVEHLYNKMILAGLSYADKLEDLQYGLDQLGMSLVFADLTCRPAEPSHFIAVPRRQSTSDNALEILFVVRGTKTLVDAITDLCGNNVDYRGGQAHEFVLKSGQFLVEKHLDLLRELRDECGASKIQLTVIGHSLGAGAAAFMALELQDEPTIDVEVYGFGTPSVLSEGLAEGMASCMTTVISDSDVVARLNGETLANVLLDVMEFDYQRRAERDITMALQELKNRELFGLPEETIDAAGELFQPLLVKHMELALAPKTTKRFEPVLFPPGKCAHFYRDGMGISARYVPNTFFREIDVTRRMVRDHLRFGYEQIFLDLMRYQNQDLYYQFDSTKISDFNKQAKKAELVEDATAE